MTPALLFDLDGTLIETDPIHAAVFVEMFAEEGREIDESYYYDHIHGRLNDDIFGDAFPGRDPKVMADTKEARFRERLGDRADPMPGLPALLDRAEAEGWGMAVVTNAPRANAEAMLAALRLTTRLPILIVGDELARGKPDPLPYQTALDQLGVLAQRSLAFDDSPSGVTSASRAGIPTLGLRSSLTHDRLTAAGAHDTIADFTDPTLGVWLDRMQKEDT
ncbi:HAD family hydrolase [Palleronia abyssalis]|uniref:Phosphorylated carbohydrates phosphatase n=1 Tax=Palleronia abyssalis TaxID=1501240 RepID=A0A2R8BU50_9RHOB|nr:HAD family phosphatase [Palleronia abyssalis]SPJ23681.1 Phosphorylated carbohydrates phosphatase [Palleronia abyssalis]